MSKATLGLIEGEAPRPDTSRANRDVLRQYENAARDLPEELRPVLGSGTAGAEALWWSRLTFGLFD